MIHANKEKNKEKESSSRHRWKTTSKSPEYLSRIKKKKKKLFYYNEIAQYISRRKETKKRKTEVKKKKNIRDRPSSGSIGDITFFIAFSRAIPAIVAMAQRTIVGKSPKWISFVRFMTHEFSSRILKFVTTFQDDRNIV